MANETLAQVPSDVSDPVVLKRFLSSLVERLDIVLGYRGSDSYASSTTVTDLAATTKEGLAAADSSIEELSSSVNTLKETSGKQEETITQVSEQVATLLKYTETALRDFNADGWPILSFFTCLGSEALNPPTTLVSGDSYTFFCTVLPTYTQTVIMLSPDGSSKQFIRSGLDWTGVVANGWLQL